MAPQSCIVACLALSLPLLAVDPPSPADPNRPVTVQTTTTQTWFPGRWMRVEAQDVWQPGHWETVQTTTTSPVLAVQAAPPAPMPVVASPASPAAPQWIAERWEQTPDGWTRYAGRWSNQPDMIVERRAIEAPTRTVVVERPVETVVVERPVYSSYSTVSVGWGSPAWNVGFGFGSPWYGAGFYRPFHHHDCGPVRPIYVPAHPILPPVGGHPIHPVGGYVPHR